MAIENIVFLRSNPIDPDPRVEKEVNSLIKAGYNVRIVAWDRNSKYKIKKSSINLNDGETEIYRFGIPAVFGGGIKNLKAFILFQKRLFFWLFFNRNSYQVIHACDFDTAYTAYYCSKLLKKKIVFDIFDYLFTDIVEPFKCLKKWVVKHERKIINNADGVIICSEKRKQQINGTSPKMLYVIHNSPIETKVLPTYHLSREANKIVYVGILQDGRFLKELAEVVQSIPNCELHIGGFGKYEGYFKDLAFNSDKIIYYGKLPYQKTLELEKSCDIMTAIYDPSIDNHYFAAPNKFYEALMIGKPLIMVRNTGMDTIVSKNDIGEVIEYNKESLYYSINKLIKRKDEWNQMSEKMRRIYSEQFSWNEMEQRLLLLYSKI